MQENYEVKLNFDKTSNTSNIEPYEVELKNLDPNKDLTKQCMQRCSENRQCQGVVIPSVPENNCWVSRKFEFAKNGDQFFSKLERVPLDKRIFTDEELKNNKTYIVNGILTPIYSQPFTRYNFKDDIPWPTSVKTDQDLVKQVNETQNKLDPVIFNARRDVITHDYISPQYIGSPSAKPPPDNKTMTFLVNRELQSQGTTLGACQTDVPFISCIKNCGDNSQCVAFDWNPSFCSKTTGVCSKNICCLRQEMSPITKRPDDNTGTLYVKQLSDKLNVYNTYINYPPNQLLTLQESKLKSKY